MPPSFGPLPSLAGFDGETLGELEGVKVGREGAIDIVGAIDVGQRVLVTLPGLVVLLETEVHMKTMQIYKKMNKIMVSMRMM